ncbi:response regulator [Flavobacterium sp. D11R37]|uniref:ATP-binding protein n=1 Tax=Flavobacterium coralii TaxID=2838017 RepID=UPI001CA6CBE0|nr:ATP-binding protein [Flavobacterium coralii]MBY8961653.1 response regulator [Flavobacterium coralii]
MTVEDNNVKPDFLSSNGQLGQLIRNHDWESTSLGPIQNWSQSLKTTINLMLNSQNPIWIGWGTENLFLYNDAYIDVLGTDKHPWALGKPASVVWEEIWDICGPLSDKVYKEGKSTNNTDVQLFMKRGSLLEEVYFSFSYSPVIDESGKVGGLFCPNFETTSKILNARRNGTLSELASKSLIEKTPEKACATAAATLSKNPEDIPFAMFYLQNNSGIEVIQRVGLEKCTETVFPKSILYNQNGDSKKFIDIMQAGQMEIIEITEPDLFPKGLAGQNIKQAIVLPLTLSGNVPAGLLICGLNPTRRLDVDYYTFFEMVSGQVATALQNATAAENERKRLEELAEIDRAKTAFFSNISHEFRTPLTLMLGPLEDMLQNGGLKQTERKSVETTHRNALRLLKLVNTLLDFSMIESGRVKAKYAPLDGAAFTASLASNFRSIIERAGIAFNVEAGKITRNVYLDKDMWEKIIFNLLSNAYKYTLRGKISVTIQEDGDLFTVQVADTGTGIPKSELPKMFTRFHRIANSAGRSFEGSGIGLSMIREFILQHGGEIAVDSEEGKGTVFTVKIPFGRKHLPEEQVSEKNYAEDVYLSDIHKKEIKLLLAAEDDDIEVTTEEVHPVTDTVLVVDDNDDMRHHVKSIIRTNYNVVTARNGKEALEKIKLHNVALVLSDVMMPVMDGLQLVKEIKKNPETAILPIILLTARAGEESRIHGYETGADDYLVKPFSSKELMARIRSHITISKSRNHIRNQIKSIFSQAPIAIIILKGSDFIVEMANAEALNMWNVNHYYLQNKPILEALPQIEKQGYRQILNDVYTTGKTYTEEEKQFTIGDIDEPKSLYLKIALQPLYDENGVISGIITIAENITAQVETRKKIEDSETKFRNLIQQAQIGIVVFKGENLKVDVVNSKYSELLGMQPWQIEGREMCDIMPELKGSYVEKSLLHVLHTGERHTHNNLPVTLNLHGKTETNYYSSVYQPLVENNKITGVVALVSKVTDEYLATKIREQNEEDLRLILETMPHIAFRANNTGMLVYYNQRFYDYTGLTNDEALGTGWQAVIHPDMLQDVHNNWMHCVNTGEEFDISFLMKRASDDMYRWHLARAVALHDDKGTVTQWVGTLTDVHEQKVFAEKLEAMVNDRTERLNKSNILLAQKNLELEQTNKELESLTYVASHDLQEPLRKIRTFINIIKDKGSPEKNEQYFTKIDTSARRMSQLIQDVLTYSRLASGSEEYVPTDLNKILEAVLQDYELAINEKNVIIQAERLPVVNAIPLHMNQLFGNLVSNALKYSNERPVISISCKTVRGFDIKDFNGNNIEQKYTEIRFADNGIGFEDKYSKQIFKMFQRLHGRNEYAGTGIGLSICKKIIEQHNGYIKAESSPGRGAVFTVNLPI